jgi:hypothetical protein
MVHAGSQVRTMRSEGGERRADHMARLVVQPVTICVHRRESASYLRLSSSLRDAAASAWISGRYLCAVALGSRLRGNDKRIERRLPCASSGAQIDLFSLHSNGPVTPG